jgi:hypothetical protein
MIVFVDTSVFMRRLLRQPGAFTDWSAWDLLHRLLQASFTALEFVPLSRAALNRAADPFPAVLGTLDAIHLASALLWMEERDEAITFLTHDTQLAIAARACGLDVKTGPSAF